MFTVASTDIPGDTDRSASGGSSSTILTGIPFQGATSPVFLVDYVDTNN